MAASSFHRWLDSTPLTHPIERRQGQLMQIILMGMIGILLLAAAITAVASVVEGRLLNGLTSNFIAACVLAVPLWALRRGRFRLAVSLVVILFLGVIGLSAMQGLQAHTMLMFALPISLAGLVLGRPALLISLAASIGFMAAAALLQATPDQAMEVFSIILNAVLLFGLLGLFLDRFGITLRKRAFHKSR